METIRIGGSVNLDIDLVWGVRDKDGDVCINDDITGETLRGSLATLAAEFPEGAPYTVDAFVSARTLAAAAKRGISLVSFDALLELMLCPDDDLLAVAERRGLGAIAGQRLEEALLEFITSVRRGGGPVAS